VNRVPVADNGKSEQQKSDDQQARGLGGVDSVLTVLVIRIGLRTRVRHGAIVRRKLWSPVIEMLNYARHSMPAPQANHTRKIVRFGVFELDLAAGELRRNGVKLRLQEQPLQVLALLLERAGSVVTREELRQKLWPSDTFVDFDHGLNTAVNKLRETLGDSASSPRYVETLARRGYRFIVPVQESASQGTTGASAGIEGKSSRNATATFHPQLEVPIPHRGLTRGLFALIQLMYMVFYVSALFRLHAIQDIAASFLPSWAALSLTSAVMVTAGAGIPLRCYLLSAVSFDHHRLGEKFQRMFPFVLALDQLWAVAPFLLMQKIGLGAAFAATAALLYVPFSERTLIRLAYVGTAGKRT
jgi:cholera toxin transcriptional activator